MHGRERVAAPLRHIERVGLGERSTASEHVVVQRSTFEQLHHEVRGAGLLEHLVDADDARVGEAGQHRRLTQEARLCGAEGLRPVPRRGDDATVAHGTVAEQFLERHRPLQSVIVGGVGDPEAAAAERALHDETPGLQGGAAWELEC